MKANDKEFGSKVILKSVTEDVTTIIEMDGMTSVSEMEELFLQFVNAIGFNYIKQVKLSKEWDE